MNISPYKSNRVAISNVIYEYILFTNPVMHLMYSVFIVDYSTY